MDTKAKLIAEAGEGKIDPDLAKPLTWEGDQPEDGMVDIFDERAQASLDTEALVAVMKQLRTQLAQSKVNLKFAQNGLLEAPGQDLHPEKFKIEVRKGRQALELIKQIWSQMGPEGIAEVTLDTYPEVPKPLTEALKTP